MKLKFTNEITVVVNKTERDFFAIFNYEDGD